jgi:hypothetical protein
MYYLISWRISLPWRLSLATDVDPVPAVDLLLNGALLRLLAGTFLKNSREHSLRIQEHKEHSLRIQEHNLTSWTVNEMNCCRCWWLGGGGGYCVVLCAYYCISALQRACGGVGYKEAQPNRSHQTTTSTLYKDEGFELFGSAHDYTLTPPIHRPAINIYEINFRAIHRDNEHRGPRTLITLDITFTLTV